MSVERAVGLAIGVLLILIIIYVLLKLAGAL
jgi:hypothetical protein